MPGRRCPTCGHAETLLAGRCPAPTSSTAICGCTCPAIPRQRTLGDPASNAAVHAVLEALQQGHRHGLGIAAHTGLDPRAVYHLLAQLEAAGWASSVLEAKTAVNAHRPPRRLYRLTGVMNVLSLAG